MIDDAGDAPASSARSPAARSGDAAAPARSPERRGRSLTYALFLAFSAVFIVWCTVDIALGVFGADAAHSAGVDSVEPSCLTGVRALDAAVERALSTRGGRRPASETAGPGAMARFDEALAPEWNEASAIEARCAATPEAARAYSAVSRFRFGAREALVHETELLPLRREVEAYLAP